MIMMVVFNKEKISQFQVVFMYYPGLNKNKAFKDHVGRIGIEILKTYYGSY